MKQHTFTYNIDNLIFNSDNVNSTTFIATIVVISIFILLLFLIGILFWKLKKNAGKKIDLENQLLEPEIKDSKIEPIDYKTNQKKVVVGIEYDDFSYKPKKIQEMVEDVKTYKKEEPFLSSLQKTKLKNNFFNSSVSCNNLSKLKSINLNKGFLKKEFEYNDEQYKKKNFQQNKIFKFDYQKEITPNLKQQLIKPEKNISFFNLQRKIIESEKNNFQTFKNNTVNFFVKKNINDKIGVLVLNEKIFYKTKKEKFTDVVKQTQKAIANKEYLNHSFGEKEQLNDFKNLMNKKRWE